MTPLPTVLSQGEMVRAEDARNSQEIAEDVFASNSQEKRTLAARALARIADDRAVTILLKGVHAADSETLIWAAYGLGFACKGRESSVAPALEARIASLVPTGAIPDNVRVKEALLRALARCASAERELKLRKFLADESWRSAAALALGDLAIRQKDLTAETHLALSDALTAGVEETLYPLSRVATPEPAKERVRTALDAALTRPSQYRLYAIRALGKQRTVPARVLGELVASSGFLPAERVEAAKGLALLGEAGKAETASLIPKVLPARDAFALGTLVGPSYAILSTLLQVFETDVPKSAEAAIYSLAQLKAPGEAPPVLGRRISALRCQAAQTLAKGDYESAVLAECDQKDTETWQRARLVALVRRPLVGARLAEWRRLLESVHVRVREAALSAIGTHPELKEIARAEIAKALTAKPIGVAATAAEIVFHHPERMQVVSARERRAALDPKAPPPSERPETDLDPQIGKALEVALKREDGAQGIELRASLLDAAGALRFTPAKATARTLACDANATLRAHAVGALKALGEALPTCTSLPSSGEVPTLSQATELVVQTEAAQVSIVLDPTYAPVTTAHLLALARSGFYKGIVIHRVVPGFVVQFGDPGGDGYGGSDKTLRCETSPVRFAALDVGMALSGRDTGSSQLFVTLARTPHLDGDYAWIGRAKGDWTALMEGDTIVDVKIKESP
jgi:cyclophilin family peptidyl-prolyl cis-trans isomerase